MMDEPNSNLDAEGEQALTEAILAVKSRGGIVIVIAHRPSALAAVDLMAVIQNGKMMAFGTKEEVLGQGQMSPQPLGAVAKMPQSNGVKQTPLTAGALPRAANSPRIQPQLVTG